VGSGDLKSRGLGHATRHPSGDLDDDSGAAYGGFRRAGCVRVPSRWGENTAGLCFAKATRGEQAASATLRRLAEDPDCQCLSVRKNA